MYLEKEQSIYCPKASPYGCSSMFCTQVEKRREKSSLSLELQEKHNLLFLPKCHLMQSGQTKDWVDAPEYLKCQSKLSVLLISRKVKYHNYRFSLIFASGRYYYYRAVAKGETKSLFCCRLPLKIIFSISEKLSAP